MRKGKYILPKPVYNIAIWMIRDYDRMMENPEFYADKINVIDEAIKAIPSEYMPGIWDNITQRKPFPEYAHRTTFSRYKSKFLMEVVTSLNLYPPSAAPNRKD